MYTEKKGEHNVYQSVIIMCLQLWGGSALAPLLAFLYEYSHMTCSMWATCVGQKEHGNSQ